MGEMMGVDMVGGGDKCQSSKPMQASTHVHVPRPEAEEERRWKAAQINFKRYQSKP